MGRRMACISLAGAVYLLGCGGNLEARDSQGGQRTMGGVHASVGLDERGDQCGVGVPSVACDRTGISCDGENHVCCFLGAELICVASAYDCARAAAKAASKTGRAWECDDSSDCPGSQVCCAEGAAGSVPWSRTCADRCRPGSQLCAQDCECAPDESCRGGACSAR